MNITLIGMPGSGKSFIGAKLADALGFSFIDPDKSLEKKYGQPLPQIIESLGEEQFLRTEAEASVAALENIDTTVLATGGSVVYSSETMEELARHSILAYLDVDLETLQERVGSVPRGIIGLGERTFSQIFEERRPLYEKWASLRINGSQSPEKIYCRRNVSTSYTS